MSAEEFLEGAMGLPAPERWRLGFRLLESLEVKDPESPAAQVGPAADPPSQ